MQRLLHSYPTTALEDWVTNIYKQIGCVRPQQINEVSLAKYFRIYLKRKERPSNYFINGKYIEISLDKRQSLEIQREMFFHELCHVLRHGGNQLMMPKALRELQEWDARNFVRYAAIPHHMLKFVDLGDPYAVDIMSSMFKVTPELCEERLSGIKNRLTLYGKEYTS